MPLNGKTEGAPGAWTKDYVEHLRTVHFSLITASFGLMIFAFAYHPEKIHLAFNEADQIDELIKEDNSLTSLVKKGEPPHKIIALSLRGGTQLEFETPRGSYLDLDHASGAYPETKPKTLAEFESMWVNAETPRHVLIIEKEAACQIFDQTAGHWIDESPFEKLNPGNQGLRIGPSVTPMRLSWSASPDESDYFLLSAIAQTGGAQTQVRLRCRATTGSVNIQELVAALLSVKPGSFEAAFPELNELVGRRDRLRPLDRIKEQLQAETAAKATDFEAFGLHIPSQIVVPCGVFVILAIQWYFFLHVSELRREFASDAPGWDVPWIGIYGTAAAKATFVLSTTVFPMIGVIALLVRGAQVGSTSYVWLFLPLAAFSLIVGILVVLYVPKKTPLKKGASVFE